jgi:hypothetical protein
MLLQGRGYCTHRAPGHSRGIPLVERQDCHFIGADMHARQAVQSRGGLWLVLSQWIRHSSGRHPPAIASLGLAKHHVRQSATPGHLAGSRAANVLQEKKLQ